MIIGSRTIRIDVLLITEFKVEVNAILLKRVNKTKYLGVIIDDELKWNDQIDKVVSTVQARLGMLRRVKQYIPVDSFKMLYGAFILPHFDYCSQIWSERFHMHTEKLCKLQKRAAILVISSLKVMILHQVHYLIHWVGCLYKSDSCTCEQYLLTSLTIL